MPGPKLSKTEREQAIADIVDRIIRGESTREIRKAMEEAWGVSYRTVTTWLGKATKEFKTIQSQYQEEALGKSLGRLNHLFVKMMDQQVIPFGSKAPVASPDLRGALLVQKEIDELLGLKIQKIVGDQTIIFQSAVPEPATLHPDESTGEEDIEE